MRGLFRRSLAAHHEARTQERHVETLAVERDEHRRRFDSLAQALEHRGFFPEGANEELFEDEAVPFPGCQPDEEGDRAGTARQPCGLRVEEESLGRIAVGERGVEREKGEKLCARVAASRNLGLARAVRRAEAPRAGVKLTSGGVYGRESQVDRLHAGKGRGASTGASLDGRPDARAEVFEKA